MKDFKSYRKNNADQGKTEREKTAAPSDFPSESEVAALAEKALAAYDGKSENAVLLEILRRAEASKRAGTLQNADLDAFYAQFSPMLNDAQRKKFQSVIERLKKI